MRTREIPRAEWPSFLARLSAERCERPVRVHVAGEDLGDQAMIDCLPLVGISVEDPGAEPGAIALTVADTFGHVHLTHAIAGPVHVYVEEDDRGAPQALDIEDAAHVKTIIMFEGWDKLRPAR